MLEEADERPGEEVSGVEAVELKSLWRVRNRGICESIVKVEDGEEDEGAGREETTKRMKVSVRKKIGVDRKGR